MKGMTEWTNQEILQSIAPTATGMVVARPHCLMNWVNNMMLATPMTQKRRYGH
jgi:hypothetical protein